jgi:TonB family protein
MIPDILAGLVRANLAASVAILLIWAIRKPVRGRFGAQAAYGLWAVPLLAALAGFAPRPAGGTPIDPIILTATTAGERLAAPVLGANPSLPGLLLAVWLVGVLAATAVLLTRQARFVASLGRLERVAPRLFRAEHCGVGPAVVGALRPRIVTPADFEARFDAAEQQVILAHEQVHLERGDARINALAATAQCLCWFNPLVHLAARSLRIDQELACDAAVLGQLPAARRLYAEVLLKTQLAAQPLPLGCHWPAGSEHPLKERIVMLKSPLPAKARRTAGAVLVTALSLGAACAAWAAAAEPPVLITNPDWIAKPTGDDIARLYPPEARKQGVAGKVTITCRVDAAGRLHNCVVVNVAVTGENLPVGPNADMGFGAASVKIAELFRMKATSKSGVPTSGAEVRIPLRWNPNN